MRHTVNTHNLFAEAALAGSAMPCSRWLYQRGRSASVTLAGSCVH